MHSGLEALTTYAVLRSSLEQPEWLGDKQSYYWALIDPSTGRPANSKDSRSYFIALLISPNSLYFISSSAFSLASFALSLSPLSLFVQCSRSTGFFFCLIDSRGPFPLKMVWRSLQQVALTQTPTKLFPLWLQTSFIGRPSTYPRFVSLLCGSLKAKTKRALEYNSSEGF